MDNLLFNLDSVEVSYGDNALTSVVQINERINDIAEYFKNHHEFNGFEKTQLADRLDKLISLNRQVQRELAEQTKKINDISEKLRN